MSELKLIPPCSYQGGKQRLSKQIVDIIFKQNNINNDTKFYDLCTGSGAVALELINRGISPTNIIMVDIGVWGDFWVSIANNEFDLSVFKKEIDKLPNINEIQNYLKIINKKPVDIELKLYHFLLQQAGSFGSKAIGIKDNKWINAGFRSYWLPTETSNRRSPVNPLMPMPETLYKRMENIVNCLSGRVKAIQCDISNIEWEFSKNDIVYIDPPYKNTSKYYNEFDYESFIEKYNKFTNIYLSEGYEINNCTNSILLSKGRTKGNINGSSKKKPVEEWLNIYN